MSRFLLLSLVCLVSGIWISSYAIPLDSAKEGHSILKRFAENEQHFTSHDVAEVLHEKEPDYFHRISKRDLRDITENKDVQNIRLKLSSGSHMHLKLRKRSLFAEHSEIYHYTEHGKIKRRSLPEDDCYATGEVEVDGEFDGMVTVALCNGLHGTATINGVEYYIHPVGNDDGDHSVHILSRRETSESGNENIGAKMYDTDTVRNGNIYKRDTTTENSKRYKREVNAETYKTATSIAIEMAVFVDAKYYAIVHKLVPGREDEYILMGLAGVNAIFSDPEKIGYACTIKIKHYENWIVDPEGYNFAESIFVNLRSFRDLTRNKYNTDMNFLHTGVTKSGTAAVGVAYVGGVCTNNKCANVLTTATNRYPVMAHEIGHNLGFGHHGAAKCPAEIKALESGFMGRGGSNFSPCNKWELYDFFSKGKGQCLFEEDGAGNNESNINLPRVFPGQYGSPDEQCRILDGDDYVYYRPFDLSGKEECAAFLCINVNKESPEYMRVKKRVAWLGFPCGDEMYCGNGGQGCYPWGKAVFSWDVEYLRSMKEEHTWSEWPEEWSECSSPCGGGVQTRRRHCQIKHGVFVSPYCRGPSFQSRLCNQELCTGEDTTSNIDLKTLGSEICARFLENNVILRVSKGATYLPEAGNVWIRDHTRSSYKSTQCLLMCERNPKSWNYLDGVVPDGASCTESKKTSQQRQRFNIDTRCVQGVCTEISDCLDNAMKDTCGVCGGDPAHCVSKVIGVADDVPEGETLTLATLPPGTTQIDIRMTWWKNKNARFEVWNGDGEKILGSGGLFKNTRYRDSNPVEYAGSSWAFEHAGYVRSAGPIDHDMVVKVSRKNFPIKEIMVDYLLPNQGA